MGDETDFDLFDEKGSWFLWSFLRSIEWKHLPDEGGILDQNEALIQDFSTISKIAGLVEGMLRADGKIGFKVDGSG